MPRITVEISEEQAVSLDALVERINQYAAIESGTSHGVLSVDRLIAMLAEDAALAECRPGSWEGTNMRTVLQSHGYPA